MEAKTDCFAYEQTVNGATCRALTALYCQTEECKFYKTPEQACKECTYSDCRNCVVADKRYKL